MRSRCTDCSKALGGGNRSGWCNVCRRRHVCPTCDGPKEVSEQRCADCRAYSRWRKHDTIHERGRGRHSPTLKEERIAVLATRVPYELPLFRDGQMVLVSPKKRPRKAVRVTGVS